MSKPIPRSRLNITYRTKIDGKPKKAKLPMRFLVLGNFSGHDRSMLDERPIHSVLPGMKLDSFMEELKLSAPIDDESLKERLAGTLEGAVTGKFTKTPDEDATEATLKIAGVGNVSGDVSQNNLGSFSGEVQISGEIKLPVVNRVPTTSTDEPIEVALTLYGKVEPQPGAEIGVTGNIEAKIKVALTVGELADDDLSIDLRGEVHSNAVPVDITIPLRSINDFKPIHLAASVPEIRRLVLLRRLVLEARNYVSSCPETREALKAELVLTKAQIGDKDAPVAGAETRIGALRDTLSTMYPQLMVQLPPAPPAD